MGKLVPWLILLFMGVAWGLSFSLAKIAMEVGGSAYGIVFWQSIISAAIIYVVSLYREPFRFEIKNALFFIVIALLGAVIPGILFYLAAPHLPAGILAITTALVPIMTYAIAAPMRLEKTSVARFTGVMLGWTAILFLTIPKTSLPDSGAVPWILLACIASACYSGENIILSKFSPKNLGFIRLACGMNIVATVILLPVTMFTNSFIIPHFPLGVLEISILGLGILNAVAYTLFVLTVQLYGPLFASQTGYIVTLSGVMWGILIFEEMHSIWVWVSLLLMIIGLFLVTPRSKT